MDLLRIDIANGKYTLIQREGGGTEILRYGEPWLGEGGRGFPGVNAVLSMAYELEELRAFKEASEGACRFQRIAGEEIQ